MKIFSTNDPFVFRAYTLVYSLVGYVFLYLLARRVTDSDFVAAVVVLFTFTCPIITYYQVGFIPSATSLSNSFIALYFFFRFREEQNHILLYWAIGLMTLAALPRPSVNILLFAMLLVEILSWLRARKIDKKAITAFAIAYALIGASIMYKNHLSAEYGTRFLTSLMPASDATEFMEMLRESWSRWRFQLLTKYHWLLLGISVIGSIMALIRGKLSSRDKEVLIISLLLLGGSALFFVALAKQFIDHEYYFIDSLYPAIILLLIPGLSLLRGTSGIVKSIWPLVFGALLVGTVVGSKVVQDEKYAKTEWDRGEVTRKNFTGADIFLDELGIARDARILVFEAYSTNAPLLLMGRRGYTILRSREESIWRALQLDFDYIVVQDVYFPSDVLYNAPSSAYTFQRKGGNGRISVFTYSEENVPGIAYPIQRIIPGLLGLSNAVYEKIMVLNPNALTDTLSRDSNTDTMRVASDRINNDVEFGGSLAVPLVAFHEANRLLVNVSFDGVGREEGSDTVFEFDVVLSIESPSVDKKYYKTHRVKRSRVQEVFFGYTCLFEIPELQEKDLILKCYIWNRFRQDLDINSVEFRAYKSQYPLN